MCQMYAIFEEVVGPQPSVTFKDLPNSENDDQGVVVDSGDPLPSTEQDVSSDSASQYGSSKSRTKRSPSRHSRTYRLKNSATLPRNGRRRIPSSSDLDDISTTSSSNPLLDTISVLTYDPPDDSDDYYDLTNAVYDQCWSKEEGDKQTKSHNTAHGTEGDRDSIGYAGSSSIDSGYKSFCPTPDLPDSSFYGTDRTNQYSGLYQDSSSSSQGRGGKPRIMMGTKVISRQGQASPASLRESPTSRRSDASLYDVNLDHLMYLRQSLLSAIQKCESSKVDTRTKQRTENVVEKSANLVEDQHYSDSSPVKSASYQKTVRFNTDVKVSTVNSSQPPSENADQNCSRTGDTSNETTGKIQSKSILKDPLCANLRSQLEAGSTDCTLEEEIDSLLYGRAEFYDLESVDEFPCSYVTMIEEKYRSGKPSLAKVRRLKGGKVADSSEKSAQAVGSDETQKSPSPPASDEDSGKQNPSKDNSPSTVSISKTAKCRFTEVARCMLEIIEDLQMKKMQPEAKKDSSTPVVETPNTNSPEAVPETAPESENASTNESKSQFYTSAAEYHVYEEIAYDLVGESSPIFRLSDVPPPLPARPNTMLVKPEQRPRAPSPPPRKSRCVLKKSQQVPETFSMEVGNRPKQRGNLYCLFSDRAERRSISRSLEREFRVSGTDNQDDDYGFRKEFLSI